MCNNASCVHAETRAPPPPPIPGISFMCRYDFSRAALSSGSRDPRAAEACDPVSHPERGRLRARPLYPMRYSMYIIFVYSRVYVRPKRSLYPYDPDRWRCRARGCFAAAAAARACGCTIDLRSPSGRRRAAERTRALPAECVTALAGGCARAR